VKEDEASFKAQAEAQKTEIEDLRRQLAEAKENCALAQAIREISEYWKNHLEKNVEELHTSKERCFEKSLDCMKKIKANFAKVGAYSAEENFIRGDPEGVVEWISGEAETFEEILSDRGDICAFSGAWGISAILEKAGCDHIKAVAQVSHPDFRGTKTRARTSSPGVPGPSLTHMMNHGTGSNVTYLLYNKSSTQNK
jgi:hypothetical protein